VNRRTFLCLAAGAGRSTGRFEYRVVVPSVAERRDNWAVKVTDLTDGRLMMIWCSTSDAELSATNKLWISFSRDEGANWDEPKLFAASSEGESVLNPCCYTHTDGRVFVFYNAGDGRRRFGLACQVLEDSGRTWGARRIIPLGEEGITSVMSSPIRLRDQSILLPLSVDRPRAGKQHFVSVMLVSRDAGKTWRRAGEIDVDAPRGAMEPTVAETQRGELLCLMRTKTGFQYESWSRDGGWTWSAARPSPFPSPEATGILIRLASGNLLFAWDNTRESGGKQVPRYPLYVALSEDHGRSWPYQRMVATTVGSQQLSNHGLFQTRSGWILLSVNHHKGRESGVDTGVIEQARFDETWIRQRNGSQSR
jgi:predicted neuraminidase